MAELFSKDGAITRMVETIPGVGWITAPIHAAAGNPIHAAKAAIAGFGTFAATVVAVPFVGPAAPFVGWAVGAGVIGLQSIFDKLKLSDDKKEEVEAAVRAGDSDCAEKILLEALSADASGRRILRSFHGTYMRAFEPEWRVDMVQTPPRGWEHWYIQDWGGKGRGGDNKPDQFLRAHPDGAVDLVGTHPKSWEMWKPYKNDDGSWSLLSVHGNWLSADTNGSVSTVEECDDWEKFWLEQW